MGQGKKAKFFKFLRYGGFIFCLGTLLSLVLGIFLYGYYRKDVPDITLAKDYRPIMRSEVFAQSGELIAEFGVHHRLLVAMNDIPPVVLQAFVASEDRRFFSHYGIDFLGIIHAVFDSLIGKRESLRGASTITQQLAKSLLVKQEGYEMGTARTMSRKVKEAILARRLEMNLTKDEILWMYLNEVYLGHGCYGVGAAAKNYFHKTLPELSLGEIAIIAGLPQAPTRFSPLNNLKAALSRQAYVLGRMQEDGFISQAELERALSRNKDLQIFEYENTFKKVAPYFSEQVRRIMSEKYGEKTLYEDGLKIYTTLDVDRAHAMASALKSGVIRTDKRQGYGGPVFHPTSQAENKAALAAVAKFNESNSLYALAQVKRVDVPNETVVIDLGLEEGVIPLSGMAWARVKDPTANYQERLLSSVKNVFAPGDVVLVKPEGNHYTLEQEPTVEGAMFALEVKSGYVNALEGGYSFEKSEFNRAYQACRQPGSVFKPVVYSAAIALKKYTPATLVMDAPLTFWDGEGESSWKPKNLGQKYRGEVTVREAIMQSMNIPALNVTADVGIKNVLDWGKKLGINSPLKSELGTGIGSSCVTPWEMGRVFLSIANWGRAVEPMLIKKVTDRDGKTLQMQVSGDDPWVMRSDRTKASLVNFFGEEKRVMDEEDAYTMHYLLTEVAKNGTARRTQSLGHPIAGKTGTTDDSFDTWFAGYTTNLMAITWVGYDDMVAPLGIYEQGGRTALPLFNDFMAQALAGLPKQGWDKPSTMCEARIDHKTGLRINAEQPESFVAPFRCGLEPALLEKSMPKSLEQLELSGGL